MGNIRWPSEDLVYQETRGNIAATPLRPHAGKGDDAQWATPRTVGVLSGGEYTDWLCASAMQTGIPQHNGLQQQYLALRSVRSYEKIAEH